MKSDKRHLLVVDDDIDILDLVVTYLESEGFRVSSSENAEKALEIVRNDKPDLAILDIILGNSDGFTLYRDIQKIVDVAVIFLSGKGEEIERIIGLELGADDFITKPFNPRELLARIRAVLRRSDTASAASDSEFVQRSNKIGPWTLDYSNQELISENGNQVRLSTGEARLLQVFLEHPNVVLNRDDLLKKTQQRRASMFDRSIDNYVSRIRKKIEKDPRNPRFLKTYWGGGYALNIDPNQ